MIRADQWLFERILSFQVGSQAPGDLVELGVYKGKSAIVIGRHQQPGETFTVCDLFEDVTSELTLHQADRNAYRTLSEEEFANNYLAFHDTLPEVVRGLSSAIEDHVTAGSCRYIHIDASHMYVNVREDAAAARRLLRKDGVVVFDDFRTEHTIGTANAVWETIVNDDLHPICASERKMYATWGDPEPYQRELMERLAESGEFRADLHTIVREERDPGGYEQGQEGGSSPCGRPCKDGRNTRPGQSRSLGTDQAVSQQGCQQGSTADCLARTASCHGLRRTHDATGPTQAAPAAHALVTRCSPSAAGEHSHLCVDATTNRCATTGVQNPRPTRASSWHLELASWLWPSV